MTAFYGNFFAKVGNLNPIRCFLLCLLVWILQVLPAGAQCDDISVKISSSDCKTSLFTVLIESEGVPAGSTCRWTLPGGTVRTVCGSFLETVTQEGMYEVILDVTLPDGRTCTGFRARIELKNTPKREFSQSPEKICSPDDVVSIQCTNLTLTKAEWTIQKPGDGTFRDIFVEGLVLSRQFAPGTYRIISRSTIPQGCNYLDTLTLTVPEKVDINLTIEPERLCAFNGETEVNVNFNADINAPGRTVQSVTWQLPGGTPATFSGRTFTARFPETNSKIECKVILSDGCEFPLTVDKNFVIAAMIRPKMTADKIIICAKDTAKFTDITPNPPSFGAFKWEVAKEDPKDNKKAFFTSEEAGEFLVKRVFENKGCTAFDSVKITVIKPEADFTAEKVERFLCDKDLVTNIKIVGYKPENTYKWIVTKTETPTDTLLKTDETQERTFPYTSREIPMSYTVTLIVISPERCTDTITKKDFIITLKPTANWDTDTLKFCKNETPEIRVPNQEMYPVPELFKWKIVPCKGCSPSEVGDTIPLKAGWKPDSIGLQDMMYIASNREGFCPDTIIRPVLVYGAEAKLSGTPKHICFDRQAGYVEVELTYEITKLVTEDTSKVTYRWVFSGDPTAVEFPEPRIMTGRKRTVKVRLKREQDYFFNLEITTIECKQEISRVGITSGVVASISLNSTENCAGRTLDFGLTVQHFAENPILSIDWQAEADETQNPDLPAPRIVGANGTKNISLIADRPGYYIVRATFVIQLNVPCTVEVNYPLLIENLSNLRLQTPDTSIQYCIPMPRPVRLIPRGIGGDVDSFAFYLTHPDDSVFRYKTEPGPFIINNLNKYGNYNLAYVVYYSGGCKDSIFVDSLIRLQEIILDVKVVGNEACDGTEATFENNSVNADFLLLDTNDGNVQKLDGKLKQFKHTFTLPPNLHPDSLYAIFPVTIVTELIPEKKDCEKKDTASLNIRVWRKPQAGFTVETSETCPPFNVRLTDRSQYATRWAWDLDGDGQYNEEIGNRNPVLTLAPRTGTTYTFRQQVTNAQDCKETTVRTLTLRTGPLPDFTVDKTETCPETELQFTDRSTSFYPVTSRQWDFGDGNTSSEINPKHKYAQPGSYTVSLTLTDDRSCTATFTLAQPIVIRVPELTFESNLPFDPEPVFFPPQAVLRVSSGNPDFVKWEWQFGEGTAFVEKTIPFEQVLPDKEQKFKVTVRATDRYGCPAERILVYNLNEIKLEFANVFTPNGDGINDYFGVELFATTLPGYNPAADGSVLRVYDRWGVIVAELNGQLDIRKGWDGTFQKQPSAEGQYFYYFKAGFFERSGSVTLLR